MKDLHPKNPNLYMNGLLWGLKRAAREDVKYILENALFKNKPIKYFSDATLRTAQLVPF